MRRPRLFVLLLLVALLGAGGCGEQALKPAEAIAAARQARAAGQPLVAIIQLRSLIEKLPDNGEARYLLGLSYNDTGSYPLAEQQLRQALESSYDRPAAVAALGRALLGQRQFKNVLDEIRNDDAWDKGVQAEILTERAMASLGLGRLLEARALLAEALAKQPGFADALITQALIAGSEKKFDEADRLVDLAIAGAPRNINAWLMKADLARVMGRPDAAAAYRKVLELDPRNVIALINTVSLQIAAGNHDEARRNLAELRKIAPDDPAASYLDGVMKFRTADYAGAREAAQSALLKAPNHVPNLLLAGAVEYSLGAYAAAQPYLARIVEVTPNNIHARKLLVSALLRTGQTWEARRVLQHGFAQAPDDTTLHVLAGEAALQDGDAANARKYFEQSVKLNPADEAARRGLAMSRFAAGDNDRALADLEAATRLDPGNYQADILLVLSHLQAGRYDGALAALRGLEAKQPDNPVTHNLKATAYLGKKDTANARKSLERALALQPTYLSAAVNLAQLDLADRNPAAARRRIEGVVQKDQKNLSALIALARIYARTGEEKKGIDALQKAHAENPESVELLEALGELQLAAGAKRDALATYVKLVSLQPKSAVALYRRGLAQAANADPAGAVESFRSALALRPDYMDARIALARTELGVGVFTEATRLARELQKRDPKSPGGFVLEGDVLMAERKFLAATRLYETAWGIAKSGALAVKLHGAYTQAGQPAEADARLTQWLKLSPDDAVARLYAADSSLKAGKHKEAASHYEWLLRKQPDDVVVLNNLALAYQQLKDGRALATAERAYGLAGGSPEVADTFGWILVEQGSVARGVEILRKAVAAVPKVPGIRYHLAQGLLKSGDKAAARVELTQLVSSGVKFAELDAARSLLGQLSN